MQGTTLLRISRLVRADALVLMRRGFWQPWEMKATATCVFLFFERMPAMLSQYKAYYYKRHSAPFLFRAGLKLLDGLDSRNQITALLRDCRLRRTLNDPDLRLVLAALRTAPFLFRAGLKLFGHGRLRPLFFFGLKMLGSSQIWRFGTVGQGKKTVPQSVPR
jgi:hypothetical protein